MDKHKLITDFEKQLEREAGVISEAVADVISIVRLNDPETAMALLQKQFLIINRQDIEGI